MTCVLTCTEEEFSDLSSLWLRFTQKKGPIDSDPQVTMTVAAYQGHVYLTFVVLQFGLVHVRKRG